MKTVLILVVSSQKHPYDTMMNTAFNTWDSFEVEGVETIYYCGNPVKKNNDKVIYFPVDESYAGMLEKLIYAIEWVVDNKKFDYVARVNSSCYVNKKTLIEFVQTLPEKNYFAGLEVIDGDNPRWMWGGGQYLMSKDVVFALNKNKDQYNPLEMEDKSMSTLVRELGFNYTAGKTSSIEKRGDNWHLVSYNSEFNPGVINDFSILKDSDHFFYRVKQDLKRHLDKYLMEELFKVL